jgi:hypothetical protein
MMASSNKPQLPPHPTARAGFVGLPCQTGTRIGPNFDALPPSHAFIFDA